MNSSIAWSVQFGAMSLLPAGNVTTVVANSTSLGWSATTAPPGAGAGGAGGGGAGIGTGGAGTGLPVDKMSACSTVSIWSSVAGWPVVTGRVNRAYSPVSGS